MEGLASMRSARACALSRLCGPQRKCESLESPGESAEGRWPAGTARRSVPASATLSGGWASLSLPLSPRLPLAVPAGGCVSAERECSRLQRTELRGAAAQLSPGMCTRHRSAQALSADVESAECKPASSSDPQDGFQLPQVWGQCIAKLHTGCLLALCNDVRPDNSQTLKTLTTTMASGCHGSGGSPSRCCTQIACSKAAQRF